MKAKPADCISIGKDIEVTVDGVTHNLTDISIDAKVTVETITNVDPPLHIVRVGFFTDNVAINRPELPKDTVIEQVEWEL